MGEKFLIDTNILIYIFSNELDERTRDRLISILNHSFNISVITKIEFLGWRNHTEDGYKKAVSFLKKASIIGLNTDIIDETVNLRRQYKIKMPDAVIAATAISHKLKLVTRNINDFTMIKDLELFNPF
ncbi:MAG: type II toxin-antitoxin system VapC family toxin [Chloroflexota bacterium]